MKDCRFVGIVLTLCVAAWLGFRTPRASAQKTKGKTRPAATKYLMRGIVQPNCAGLAKLLKDVGPADAKAWEMVACHASCLNEMSFVLMDDGRCPDAVWAKSAKTLRGCTASLLTAIEKKDAEAAQAAFQGVTESCSSCHKQHRPKK